MKKLIKSILRQSGWDIVPYQTDDQRFPADLRGEEQEIYKAVAPFTMTGPERIAAAINATQYVVENGISGDIVECGVWRGGSMMAIASTLQRLNVVDRKLYLYDTFEGMPEATEKDVEFDGTPAEASRAKSTTNGGGWCYADETDVLTNLRSTGYPHENIHLIKGKVEETIPGVMPENISVLRLDTDWYESTKHELAHLYPRLAQHGVLIIDDYGHWQGARQAVDEFFGNQRRKPFLHRIDYTGRLIIKM